MRITCSFFNAKGILVHLYILKVDCNVQVQLRIAEKNYYNSLRNTRGVTSLEYILKEMSPLLYFSVEDDLIKVRTSILHFIRVIMTSL